MLPDMSDERSSEIETRGLSPLARLALGIIGLAAVLVLHPPGPVIAQGKNFSATEAPATPATAAAITLDTRTVATPRAGGRSARSAAQAVEHRLRLTGTIGQGDADRLRGILQRLGASPSGPGAVPVTIELASQAGDLIEGYRVGTLLKEFGVVAVVRKGDTCDSACALAFLGGNVRNAPADRSARCNLEIGGRVAFHNFWLIPPQRDGGSNDPVTSRLQGFNDATGGTARLLRYAADMGMQAKFVGDLMGRSADELQYIETVDQFLGLNICPIGLERPAIPKALQASNICNHSTGWLPADGPLQVTEIPARHAKRHLLERVQTNMQARTRAGLAGQFSSGAVMRAGEETDRLYEDLQAAGVALPDIVGATFEVGRHRRGVYEVACFVSLSADDPDKFDVVVQTPKGLAPPPVAPLDNCRRLFLFDREAVINRKV